VNPQHGGLQHYALTTAPSEHPDWVSEWESERVLCLVSLLVTPVTIITKGQLSKQTTHKHRYHRDLNPRSVDWKE